MAVYDFTLTGTMPLLMHSADIDSGDELEAWRKAPENKGKSKAGDDRSPSWTWQTYCYYDGDGNVCMPADNLMAALRKAGAKIILKKQTTFKALSQSGLFIVDEFCEFKFGPKLRSLNIADIPDRKETFEHHSDWAKKTGFSLLKKRAAVGQSKHVRVRPRFDEWQVSGRVEVLADEITRDILQQLFDLAGREGLGDWRPGGKTPGPYGQFTAKIAK